MTEKPTLHHIRPTPAAILSLYTKLTGKIATDAEKAEVETRYAAKLQADQI